MEVVASLSQGRTAAAQCGLFTYKSVPVIFEPLCILGLQRQDFLSFKQLSVRIPTSRFCHDPNYSFLNLENICTVH